MIAHGGRLAIGALAATLALASVACGNGEGDSQSELSGIRIRAVPTVTVTPTAATTASPTTTGTTTPATTPSPPSPTASPPPTATPPPAASASPTTAPSLTAEADAGAGLASVELSPTEVKQGEVFVARLRNAAPEANPTLFFAGLPYPMLWDGNVWWSVVGIGADFPPGQYWVQVSAGEEAPPTLVLTVVDAAFPEEYIELAPETAQLLTDAEAIEAERQLLASLYAGLTPQRLWSGPFVVPVAGEIGNVFGLLRSFNGGPFSPHSGLDIGAEEGQPVAAANSGRVAFAGPLHLRGNTVIIDHGAGVFSGYHHLSQIQVAEGQDIAQGEVVGAVGATGLVTAAHLHWELLVHGVRVDPLAWTETEIGP